MNQHPPVLPPAEIQQGRSSWRKKLLITGVVVLGVCGISAGSAALWYNYNFNASSFRPIQLTAAEQQVVEQKMAELEGELPASDPSKTIVLNEREINGFLEQQGLGETVKVQIKKDGVGATFLVPVDEQVALIGGHTIRLNVAFNTKLDDSKKFMLSLADVNVGGISLPNAWLGNIKGLNLLADSGNEGLPMVNAFAAGIKALHMKNGEMRLVLND